MANSIAARLDAQARETPQWRPWLARVDEALAEDASRVWDAIVVEREDGAAAGVTALEGATVRVPAHLFGPVRGPSALAAAAAQTASAETEMAALPFLHACGRAVGSARSDWSFGFCPTCGAWPTFAEARGLERTRHLRCARCAADWMRPRLTCVYCGESAHERLTALVPERESGRRIDACRSCRGYVKTFSTLTALTPHELPLEDLATVALDVVALERGFERPRFSPHAAKLRVVSVP